jgi:hypothetical protein
MTGVLYDLEIGRDAFAHHLVLDETYRSYEAGLQTLSLLDREENGDSYTAV